MGAMKSLVTHPVLDLYPSITEHIFDVAVFLSDYISDEARNQIARLDSVASIEDTRCLFILGVVAPVDGWLVLTKPVNPPLNLNTSQPPTPTAATNQQSPLQSPLLSTSGPATPQQRYFNQQQQQRQQQMQAQQAQQSRAYSPYAVQSNKMLPAQLQRTPSLQGTPSPLQQMQHMQQMQGLAQQRAMQPSPVYSQRMISAAGQGQVGGSGPGKLQIRQEKEMRHYPFVQPRWEILAESSGNPNANETAISMSLFGARRV
jgi:mediator of RNA polymerase II transcription subunit 12